MDSLQAIACHQFEHFFLKLKAGFPNDSTSYKLGSFSPLTKKFAYSIELVELASMENYASLDEFYLADSIRKLDSITYNDLLGVHPKVKKSVLNLQKMLMQQKNKRDIGTFHHFQKQSFKLKKQLKKYPPPHAGYFQNAQIEIHYPSKNVQKQFLIEYSRNLDIVNFGVPYSSK
jgi:hypothetical protein